MIYFAVFRVADASRAVVSLEIAGIVLIAPEGHMIDHWAVIAFQERTFSFVGIASWTDCSNCCD
jgi:hypothetical protein